MKTVLKVLVMVILIITVSSLLYMVARYQPRILNGRFYLELRDYHNSHYSEKSLENANIAITVSNQSYDKPKIKMNGFVDNEELFSDTFYVADQHQVTYFYDNRENGKYLITFLTSDNVEENIEIEIEDNKKYLMVLLYENKINVTVSDNLLMIK